MKVFISWSGKQSHAVANALRDWLPGVVPSSRPWVSSVDIPAGGPRFATLMQELESAQVCVICITPDNLRSPWVYFEAGAIDARHHDAKVCGFLTGISLSQIPGPFAQFHCVEADMDGAWSLVRTINDSFLDKRYDEQELNAGFRASWPRLRESLNEALLLYDPRSIPFDAGTDQPEPSYKLSEEACELLAAAAADRNGSVMMSKTMKGFTLQTNGRQMCELQNPRSEARWRGAVRDLVQQGLIDGRGHKGEVFSVTAEGYRVADGLEAKAK